MIVLVHPSCLQCVYFENTYWDKGEVHVICSTPRCAFTLKNTRITVDHVPEAKAAECFGLTMAETAHRTDESFWHLPDEDTPIPQTERHDEHRTAP